MLPEQVQLHGIPLLMMIQNWENMHGIVKTRVIRHILLARKRKTDGDCTMYTAMCGNGCRMNGMIPIMVLRMMVVPRKMELALTGIVVAAGSTMPRTAGRLAATTTSQATATSTSAFAFFRKCNPFLFYPSTTYNSFQS